MYRFLKKNYQKMEVFFAKLKNKASVVKIIFSIILAKIKYKNRILYLLLTPLGGNLGDQAISFAELSFINQGFPDMQVFELSDKVIRNGGYLNRLIYRLIGSSTILITGGGSLGTLWFEQEELLVRDVIRRATKAKIIIFPQSIYYEKDSFGEREFEKSKQIYNAHPNLTVCVRETISYGLVKDAYRNVCLIPDMVLSLNRCRRDSCREGILLCLRDDVERTLSRQEEQELYKGLAQVTKERITVTDMMIPRIVPPQNRSSELDDKFEQFISHTLVITDRLHAMIFSAITGTPCIVIASKSHKLIGCYEWIKELPYIQFAENIEDVLRRCNQIPLGNFQYDQAALVPYFDQLKELIRKA